MQLDKWVLSPISVGRICYQQFAITIQVPSLSIVLHFTNLQLIRQLSSVQNISVFYYI